jgi:hypothetical protein
MASQASISNADEVRGLVLGTGEAPKTPPPPVPPYKQTETKVDGSQGAARSQAN